MNYRAPQSRIKTTIKNKLIIMNANKKYTQVSKKISILLMACTLSASNLFACGVTWTGSGGSALPGSYCVYAGMAIVNLATYSSMGGTGYGSSLSYSCSTDGGYSFQSIGSSVDLTHSPYTPYCPGTKNVIFRVTRSGGVCGVENS